MAKKENSHTSARKLALLLIKIDDIKFHFSFESFAKNILFSITNQVNLFQKHFCPQSENSQQPYGQCSCHATQAFTIKTVREV